MALFKKIFQKKEERRLENEIEDWDERTKQLTTFRKAYHDFFIDSAIIENSDLQRYSTQMLWHGLYLQKLRMRRLGIKMDFESKRIDRRESYLDLLLEDTDFDGYYEVNEINESLYTKRTFYYHGEEIETLIDRESANYSILSAKQQGKHSIVCPCCGNISNRDNLIDGCDYCGTVFTIEDLEDRIGNFNIHFDLQKKGESASLRDLHLEFDQWASNKVRGYDPNFSFRSFMTSLNNKMFAIHYADSAEHISAFSDIDLSEFLNKYKYIVNLDIWHIRMDDYTVADGMQKMELEASFVLYELIDGTIQQRNEVVKLNMEKSADCKTQLICEPSVMKCNGCGASRTLMDGKVCHHCGRELDLKQYDWVITKYVSTTSNYGRSWRLD